MASKSTVSDSLSLENDAAKSGITSLNYHRMILRLDGVITRLIEYQVLKGRYAQVTELEISQACLLVSNTFLDEASCVDIHLDTPLYIIGDVFGQYGDLLRIFNILGHPPEVRYLFLGNYINRGDRSIETMTLLFCYKARYPQSIFLLRGNHECKLVSQNFGLYTECVKRYSVRLWKFFVTTFDYMPVAAIVEDEIFCTHSGISPSFFHCKLETRNDLREHIARWVVRPTDIHTNSVVTHLLWSESDAEVEKWVPNPSGLGNLYGPDVVTEFADRYQFQQVIRSNEVFMSGYDFFVEPRLLTIFSAPNFHSIIANDGTVVSLKKSIKDGELKARIKTVRPIMGVRDRMTAQMTIEITDDD